MNNKNDKINISILPEQAKQKLLDFYEFLLNKYGKKKEIEMRRRMRIY